MGQGRRKIPLRKCVVTKDMLPKQELLRVVRNKEGEVFVDLTGKQNGRGAYLSKRLDVIEKAQETNILKDHLKVDIKDDLYDELKKIIEK